MTKLSEIKINKLYIIFTILIAAFMFGILIFLNDITPFGDKTFLVFDMKRQYVDFYGYYKSIIQGRNSIFYTFDGALGYGSLGFFIYYLTSPFLLILSLFPVQFYPLGITLIIGCKIVLIAFSMVFYLLKKNNNSIYSIIGALAFSFSGFVISQSMNTMWIDVLVLFPILMYFLEIMILEGKNTGYVFTLIAMFWLNYYITYQVLIFVFIWTIYIILINGRSGFVKKTLKVIYASFVSGLTLMIALLPVAIELFNSPKDILKEGLKKKDEALLIKDIIKNIIPGSYEIKNAFDGGPIIYITIPLFIFFVLFFCISAIDFWKRIGIFGILLIFMFSFLGKTLNLLWHAGMEPSGYPFREAFMLAFVMIVCSTEALCDLKAIKLKNLLIGILISGLVLYLALCVDKAYLLYSRTVYIIIVFAVCSCYVLISRFCSKRIIYLVFGIFFSLLLLTELILNGDMLLKVQLNNSERASYFKNNYIKTNALVNDIREKDDSFYRIENLTPREQNDSMIYDYMGVTHYSSSGLLNVRKYLQSLGLNDNGLYTEFGRDVPYSLQSLLGIKYLISEDNVYKNDYSLPIGIYLNDVNMSFTDINNNSFDNIDNYFSFVLNKRVNVFKNIEYNVTSRNEADTKIYDYHLNNYDYDNVYMYIPEIKEKGIRNIDVYSNDKFLMNYGNMSNYRIVKLNDLPEENASISLSYTEKIDAELNPIFVTEDIEKLKAFSGSVNKVDIKRNKKNELSFEVMGNGYVLLTIPYEKGWHIYSDNRRIEPIKVFDTFMLIPLEAGSSHITMRFVPTGFYLGLALTVLGIVLLLNLTNMTHKVKIILFEKN